MLDKLLKLFHQVKKLGPIISLIHLAISKQCYKGLAVLQKVLRRSYLK